MKDPKENTEVTRKNVNNPIVNTRTFDSEVDKTKGDFIRHSAYLFAMLNKECESKSSLPSQVLSVYDNIQKYNENIDNIEASVIRNQLIEYIAISNSSFLEILMAKNDHKPTDKILANKMKVDKHVLKLLSLSKNEQTPPNHIKVKAKNVNIAMEQKIDQRAVKDNIFVGKIKPKKSDKKSPPNQHVA